jgi:hypothetical protein
MRCGNAKNKLTQLTGILKLSKTCSVYVVTRPFTTDKTLNISNVAMMLFGYRNNGNLHNSNYHLRVTLS